MGLVLSIFERLRCMAQRFTNSRPTWIYSTNYLVTVKFYSLHHNPIGSESSKMSYWLKVIGLLSNKTYWLLSFIGLQQMGLWPNLIYKLSEKTIYSINRRTESSFINLRPIKRHIPSSRKNLPQTSWVQAKLLIFFILFMIRSNFVR